MTRYAALFILTGVVGASTSALAHHGPGQFNGPSVTVTGVVTQVRLVNPHGYVYFDVKNDQGKTETWRCEMQAWSLLKRAGWTADMFPIGGKITVTGNAGTSERTACLFQSAILADGTTVGRADQRRKDVDNDIKAPSKFVNGKLDLNGTWAAPQRYVQPEDAGGGGGRGAPGGTGRGAQLAGGMGPGGPGGRGPGGPGGRGAAPPAGITLTDAGKAAVARFQASGGINPRQQCKATNIFFDWTFDRHVNQIIQTKDTITMKYGLMDLVRTIHLNMDKHPSRIVPSQAGHSIGRLEGATLHVDTIGFANDGFISNGLIYSNQLHVTETFTYKAEDSSLTRKFSAVDPLNFTGTYSGEDEVYVSNTPFEDYSCVDLKDAYIEPIKK